MERIEVTPRSELKRRLKNSGLLVHKQELVNDGLTNYWDENSVYCLSLTDVEKLVELTNEIIPMSLQATEFILNREWGDLGLPVPVLELARRSFNNRNVELFTRYDFAYFGGNDYRLVNIESEAPKFLLETSQTQRLWLQDVMKTGIENGTVSQFNVISDLTFQAFEALYSESEFGVLHVTNSPDPRNEDWATAAFVLGLAGMAGWTTGAVRSKDIRWNQLNNMWVDPNGSPILALYKQMTWDALLRMPIGMDAVLNAERLELLLEPAWNIIHGHRTVLAAMSHLFPNHNALLPHKYGDPTGLGNAFTVATPHQWTIKTPHAIINNEMYRAWGEPAKDYSKYDKLVYGKLEMPKKVFDTKTNKNHYVYASVYTVGGRIAGLGVREEKRPLLGQHSIFKPHFIQK